MLITPLFEVNANGPRFYQDDLGQRYVSVTSCLAEESGPYYGSKWAGIEGEALHCACLNWIAHEQGIERTFDLPDCPGDYPNPYHWGIIMASAVLGFQRFVKEYKVELIGVEVELASPVLNLIGHVDLLCHLEWISGRIKAVIDLKFVASITAMHERQVRIYSRLPGAHDAQMGFIYWGTRGTDQWRLRPVNLTAGLADVLHTASIAKRLLKGEPDAN